MQIEFVSSMAPITDDPEASRRLYVEALGLPLEGMEGSAYLHSEAVPGTRHFGVWPLTEAAEACFGTPAWPAEHPVPQASIEFEVATPDAVADAARELAEDFGYPLLHAARLEPWGQTVARLLSPEGLVVGISYAPWMHAD
jgi:catechol 2,3-dioxygenase-like lactoylglutathione lyase family enzyme